MELKQATVLELEDAVKRIEEAKDYLKNAGINQWQSRHSYDVEHWMQNMT